jgi:hypothetical protein
MRHYRSSITGRYVTKRYATAHPDSTIAEQAGVVAALRARITALLSRSKEPT